MNVLMGSGRPRKVATVVIGAGHCGLAMSYCLSQRAIDHVVLERGEVANSWRRERWDSLRLLTPNWQTSLPGFGYRGSDPDGFMSMPEVISFIDRYATTIAAPVETGVCVTAVQPRDGGYRVDTTAGCWLCRTLVIASGAFNKPVMPRVSTAIPSNLLSLTTQQYRNPEQLPQGGVLIVGGSATGLQLADEIHRSGRPVSLSVGEHVRMPRCYRGRDIFWWMDKIGVSDQRYDEVDDLRRVRGVPSPQLVGTADKRTLNLNGLASNGVKVVGRLMEVRDHCAQFSGALSNVCKLADLKMNRLLDSIDQWAEANGLNGTERAGPEFQSTRVDECPALNLDLSSGEIKTVIWATGYRPDYSWLQVPVLDRKGNLRHDGGVVDAPGIYVMGLPFMRRRKSSFIYGAEEDAVDLSDHLVDYLHGSYRSSLVQVV